MRNSGFPVRALSGCEVGYIPIVRRKDEAEHGEYGTKRVILEIYDAMAACGGIADYQIRLKPLPADPLLSSYERATCGRIRVKRKIAVR